MNVEPYFDVVPVDSKQLFHVFFAFRLESIGLASKEPVNQLENISWQLNRQIDFISTLPSLGEGSAIELRFHSQPVPKVPYRGRVEVLLRVRVDVADKKSAHSSGAWAYAGLWPTLMTVSDVYNWTPISEKKTYHKHFGGAKHRFLAEILRRELMVQLDRVLPTPAKRGIGFHSNSEISEKSTTSESTVHVVIPYIRTYSTLATLFNVMLLQPHPVTVSIALSPTNLSNQELDYLLEQSQRCERYLQLPGTGPVSRPEVFIPPLRAQANMVLESLNQNIFRLRDDCVLLKVQLASLAPLSPAMIDALGITISEPVASNDKFSDAERSHRYLAGGYDWVAPVMPEQEHTLNNNFDNILFDAWAPSLVYQQAQRLRYLADPCQANAAFRFPVPEGNDFPGLDTRLARLVAPPFDLPDNGLYVGDNIYRGMSQPVRLLREDRRRHTYMLGQTGTGKSSLLLSMIMQDIRGGEGVCVLDPHGELVGDVLSRIPEERAKDVIYFNPEDQRSVIGLNLLEYRDDVDKDSAVNHLLEIFDKLYDLRQTGGPMFEMYLRNSALLVMSCQTGLATIDDILRVFSDSAFRKRRVFSCQDRFVKDFWQNIAARTDGDASLANIAPYITSKFSRLLYNSVIRPIVSQQKSTVNFVQAMSEGKIVLVDLCKGKLGETNASFLGMVLISLIQRAAFARSTAPKTQIQRDFYLYVDEFQNLATESFIGMLSEARKYRLNLMLTNQYLYQIPEAIHNAVLGNVGTQISFRVGMKDAKILEDKFAPLIGRTDLMNLPNYNAYITTLIGGEATKPFSIKTRLDPMQSQFGLTDSIIEISRQAYGRPKNEVDQEINQRWKIESEA